MDFPILEICDDELGEGWLRKYFHPRASHCLKFGSSVKHARDFGRTSRSQVTRHRCRHCQTVYTIYTGTVFANKQLRPAQVILLLRGVVQRRIQRELVA